MRTLPFETGQGLSIWQKVSSFISKIHLCTTPHAPLKLYKPEISPWRPEGGFSTPPHISTQWGAPPASPLCSPRPQRRASLKAPWQFRRSASAENHQRRGSINTERGEESQRASFCPQQWLSSFGGHQNHRGPDEQIGQDGAQVWAFPTSSQVTLIQLVLGTHFESH